MSDGWGSVHLIFASVKDAFAEEDFESDDASVTMGTEAEHFGDA